MATAFSCSAISATISVGSLFHSTCTSVPSVSPCWLSRYVSAYSGVAPLPVA